MSSPGTDALDIYRSPEEADEDSLVLQGRLTQSEADTAVKSQRSSFDTLNEPIRETFVRDLKAVGSKFGHVLVPVKKEKSLLKDWDLWGPLILCTFMACLLQGEDGDPQFAEVFVIVWIGSLVVTLNTKLLGGHISFFQSVCVLGYCLFPISLSLALCRVVLIAEVQTTILFAIRCVAVLAGFLWASYASLQFLGDCQTTKRRALAAYPMVLFYFVLAWMVLSHSN